MIHHLDAIVRIVMPARKVTTNAADRLTITLDVEDRAELERLSVKTDRSLAWYVREALREYLAKTRAPEGEHGKEAG